MLFLGGQLPPFWPRSKFRDSQVIEWLSSNFFSWRKDARPHSPQPSSLTPRSVTSCRPMPCTRWQWGPGIQQTVGDVEVHDPPRCAILGEKKWFYVCAPKILLNDLKIIFPTILKSACSVVSKFCGMNFIKKNLFNSPRGLNGEHFPKKNTDQFQSSTFFFRSSRFRGENLIPVCGGPGMQQRRHRE